MLFRSEIRKLERRMPIIMFSTLTHKGAQATVLALTRGASDYVEKPGSGSIDMAASFEVLASQLIPKVIALGRRIRPVEPGQPAAVAPPPRATATATSFVTTVETILAG